MKKKLKDFDAIFLIGDAGSGKTTQGERHKKNGFQFIDASPELKKKGKEDSTFGNIISQAISEGALVPDEIVIRALMDSLKNKINHNQNVILTGFLRTVLQAKEFPKLLESLGYNVCVCFLNIYGDVTWERMDERKREDDANILARCNRIKAYGEHVSPVVHEILCGGHNVYSINANLSPDEVYVQIQRALYKSKR